MEKRHFHKGYKTRKQFLHKTLPLLFSLHILSKTGVLVSGHLSYFPKHVRLHLCIFSLELNYSLMVDQGIDIVASLIQSCLDLSLFYFLIFQITCNNQKNSSFMRSVVIWRSESVFWWVTLLHRFDCQGVDVFLFVLMTLKITYTWLYSLLLLPIPDCFKPAFVLFTF